MGWVPDNYMYQDTLKTIKLEDKGSTGGGEGATGRDPRAIVLHVRLFVLSFFISSFPKVLTVRISMALGTLVKQDHHKFKGGSQSFSK